MCLNDHLVFMKILGIQSLKSINTCHKTTDQETAQLASPGQQQWPRGWGKLATTVEHVGTCLKMQQESGRVVWSGKVGRQRKNGDLLEVVKKKKKGIKSGNSLAIQWLGRSTFTTEPGSIPGQGTKIPYAAQSFKKYPREGFKTNKQTNTTTQRKVHATAGEGVRKGSVSKLMLFNWG